MDFNNGILGNIEKCGNTQSSFLQHSTPGLFQPGKNGEQLEVIKRRTSLENQQQLPDFSQQEYGNSGRNQIHSSSLDLELDEISGESQNKKGYSARRLVCESDERGTGCFEKNVIAYWIWLNNGGDEGIGNVSSNQESYLDFFNRFNRRKLSSWFQSVQPEVDANRSMESMGTTEEYSVESSNKVNVKAADSDPINPILIEDENTYELFGHSNLNLQSILKSFHKNEQMECLNKN